jgi:hypothetical protein
VSDDIRQSEEDVCVVLLRELYTGVELSEAQLREMAKDFINAAYRNAVSGMHVGGLARKLAQAVREGAIHRTTFKPNKPRQSRKS